MDDFDRLIASLRDANPVHSSGEFTVDVEAARQRAGYLLPSPHHAGLSLVRAAVAGGAQFLNVEAGRSWVRVRSDDAVWTKEELGRIADDALLGETGRLHFLATAAHASRAAGRKVLFEGRVRLNGDQQGWRISSAEHKRGNHAEIVAPWGFFKGDPRPLLRRHLLYLPLPCGFNGRPLGPPLFGQEPNPSSASSTFAYLGAEFGGKRAFPPGYHLSERYLTAPRWDASVLAAPTRRHPKIFVGLDRDPKVAPVELAHTQALVHDRVPGPPQLFGEAPEKKYGRPGEAMACYALLAIAPELEGPGLLVPVKEGVILGATEADLGCPGALAVVSAHGLTEDLSQFGVVRNAAYDELLSYLRGQFREMLEALPDWLPRVGNFQTEKTVIDRLSCL